MTLIAVKGIVPKQPPVREWWHGTEDWVPSMSTRQELEPIYRCAAFMGAQGCRWLSPTATLRWCSAEVTRKRSLSPGHAYEVDETYGRFLMAKRVQGTKRGRGTTKQAVFGILCRGGLVWAQVVPVEAKTLLPLLHQRVQRGSIVCSDTFTSYTGVARGADRLVDHSQAFSDRQGSHVNGWRASGSQAASAAKGGVRRTASKLALFGRLHIRIRLLF